MATGTQHKETGRLEHAGVASNRPIATHCETVPRTGPFCIIKRAGDARPSARRGARE